MSCSLALAGAAPIERFVEAPGPIGPRKGMMLTPASGPSPVALIVPGSGPTDRDGNGDVGLRAETYRYLAEGLAAQGIATVRIDKRGMYGSKGAVADANDVTIAAYAADVRAWIATIRAQTGSSCVWLIGHSEGGLVSLVAASRGEALCGLVLIAAPGRPLGAVIREQLAANPTLEAQAAPILAALEQGRRVDGAGLSATMLALFRPAVQGFLIDEMSYDPAALVARIDRPLLIVQGDNDLQVSVADARRLKAAAPTATLALLPRTNHVLKVVSDESRAANLATYADPSLPVAPAAVDAIAGFIRAGRR